MLRLGRRSLRQRVSDLEEDVQYKDLYFNESGNITVYDAIEFLFKYLDVTVGLQKKDASKTS